MFAGSDEEKGSDEENNVQRNQGRGSDVDDDDEEEDEWEKEQLRKVGKNLAYYLIDYMIKT